MKSMVAYMRHEDYQPSGEDWLGDVPAGWAIKKMKYLFRDHSQKGRPNAELLSVTQNQGVVPRSWVENRMVMPTGGLDTFKFIEKGDFAISLRSFEGGLEYCHHDGIISPAYTVLKAWHSDLEPGYYRYLFKSGAFISELQTSVVGIREGKNISFVELSHSRMPIPPLGEQRAIAAFLDEKCAKVDEAVRIKEEQIALLRERRQILIQQAVTRGLNPAAPMKDSGIDWIGQIPAHWKVRRSKYVFTQRKELARKDDIQLSATQSYGVIPQDEFEDLVGRRVVKIQTNLEKRKHVEIDDFVISMRSFQGGLERAFARGCIRSSYVVLQPLQPVNADFYGYLFKSPRYIKALQATGSFIRDGQDLNFDNFSKVDLFLPPLHEQAEIAAYIRTGCEKIDNGVAIKEKQIAALKEYKTSMINAAVTGKIKVA